MFRSSFMRPKVRFRPRLKPGEMTKLEQRYEARLALLKKMGQIIAYWPHKFTWKLSDNTHYRADFLVLLPDMTLEIHETKGGKKNKATGEYTPWAEEDAMLKAKWVAEQCPIPIRIAFEAGTDNWQFKEIGEWHGRSEDGTSGMRTLRVESSKP